MIAIRTHWNPAEAALEKTLLDNYEIPCALLYENANLYGRAPLAMPIRLVVRDDHADWAMCILNGDFEAAAKLEQIPAGMSPEGSESSLPGLPQARPWELLVIAFYFFLPAICFFADRLPSQIFVQPGGASRNRRRNGRSFSRLACNRICLALARSI
jgi:hypothetical protein